MITETQLLADKWTNVDDEGQELGFFFSPKGKVAVDINEQQQRIEICIYQDAVDDEGYWSALPTVEIYKPLSLTIEELRQFTDFMETEID